MPKKLSDQFRAQPEDGRVALAGVDPGDTRGLKRKRAKKELWGNGEALGELQSRLDAEGTRSLLVVLQALDTGGKDGTIKHAMSGFNPQGVRVAGFKAPTRAEASHHYLWRIRRQLPEPGEVVIFNRSHYEDVIVPQVKQTLPDATIRKRYREINRFERELSDRGTRVVKLFLHISFDEQRRRLLARLRRPDKLWKFAESDIDERGSWDSYQAAFDETITATSTDYAPWYLIPADNKWFRNWAVSHILIDTLNDMDPKFPKPRVNVGKMIKRLRPAPTGR